MDLDTFERGITIRFKATFKDTAGTVTDPADQKAYCSIFTPAGTEIIDTQEGDRDSTGVYTYDYTIPVAQNTGIWKVEWTGTVDSLTAMGRKKFRIIHTRPGI